MQSVIVRVLCFLTHRIILVWLVIKFENMKDIKKKTVQLHIISK